MGYGDELMGTGMARGLAAQGKRAAFGDGRRIIWGPWCKEVFRNNPNVAPPGSERADDLVWIAHYKGNRAYNQVGGKGWIWNYGFRPVPGEVFFDEVERAAIGAVRQDFVLIEPNAPVKALAPNKQWPNDRWQRVADALRGDGLRVVQLLHPGTHQRLSGAELVPTKSFREALGVLSRADLFLGHEGGMHHGAAAVQVPAVVIFGGFIPVSVTGYPTHINLGSEPACGSTRPCEHCRAALSAITVETVLDSARGLLNGGTVRTARAVGRAE